MKFGQSPMPPGPGMSPGAIRDTLGSGLKSSGVFQKDGHIQNMRGGFMGPKQGSPYPMPIGLPQNQYPQNNDFGGQTNLGMQANSGIQANNGVIYNSGIPVTQGMQSTGKGPFSFLGGNGYGGGFPQSRQLILQAAGEGINGNGVATISPDNTFVMVANLPPPQTFQTAGYPGGGRGNAVYASYLVDKKGKSGFFAGVLSPVGSGVYRTQFRSQVPLDPYERVVVSVENPQQIGQAPNGPIILTVKGPTGPIAFLTPFKNAAGSVWGKISGFTKWGAKAPIPAPEVIAPEGSVPPMPPVGTP
ncbi:MAG: hypothetical protein ACYCVD_05155 [Desulfitobacteriaceae bacterium]